MTIYGPNLCVKCWHAKSRHPIQIGDVRPCKAERKATDGVLSHCPCLAYKPSRTEPEDA